ncbi:MAG: hypothetical protein JZU65_05030 [Chlorobium sp.]|jgi:hypothetical protein|nr:hypothetical protein [Chlorobium sp.]
MVIIPDKISIILDCLFCGEPLEGPNDAPYSSGDLIKCQKCGEENDYDSVIEVAKEKGMTQMKDVMEGAIAKEFKGLFKRTH